MKQEDKDLLLKDLCARMPYDVYVRRYVYTTSTDAIESVELFDLVWLKELYAEEAEFKPYLFPLSSITEEQYNELGECLRMDIDSVIKLNKQGIKCAIPYSNIQDWYNTNHFDYRGLINKGLAIDCTNLNIY